MSTNWTEKAYIALNSASSEAEQVLNEIPFSA